MNHACDLPPPPPRHDLLPPLPRRHLRHSNLRLLPLRRRVERDRSPPTRLIVTAPSRPHRYQAAIVTTAARSDDHQHQRHCSSSGSVTNRGDRATAPFQLASQSTPRPRGSFIKHVARDALCECWPVCVAPMLSLQADGLPTGGTSDMPIVRAVCGICAFLGFLYANSPSQDKER